MVVPGLHVWHYEPVDGLEEVWDRFRAGQSELRDRLILQYAPLVKFAAGRVPGDPRETVQLGLESLKAAIDTYEPDNGRFESYAMEVISDAYSWENGWSEVG